MIAETSPRRNRLNKAVAEMQQWVVRRLAAPTPPTPLVRPNLAQLARPDAQLPAFVATCPVACKYLELLGALDWDHFPERDRQRPWPGSAPAPRAPYVAAYLVKLDQEKRYMSGLRRYLVEHPALVWVLGFPLAASTAAPWGFDVEASVPSRKQLSRVLRKLPNPALQFLLTGVVRLLQQELPADVDFGDAVSVDTKHIIAWVRENNLKNYVKDRFDKDKQPRGDLDCRLGCKRKHNRTVAEGNGVAVPPPTPTSDPVPTKTLEVGDYYWGYASGVVSTKVENWGEFVLAELTQTFDKGDATYFFPLMAQVEERLGHRPRYGALDMAYDAHYVYDYFHQAGGFAAVPLAERGDTSRQFDGEGLPLCKAGLSMPLKGKFLCNSTKVQHQRGRYVCPLRFPQPAAATCPIADPHWDKGGCVVTMPTSQGARIRYQLDRQSAEYKTIYKQRTADERVNSQAVDLGIERPKLRNGQAITNQNTLTYVLINLRGLHRVRAHKAELAHQEMRMTGR